MPTAQLEQCANCERTIGKLETAHVWKQAIVCTDCFRRLSKAEPVAVDPLVADDDFAAAVAADVAAPATPSYYTPRALDGSDDRERMMRGVNRAAASSGSGGPAISALGLNSRGLAWTIALVGGLLSPVVVGIPLLVWGLAADHMIVKEQKRRGLR